MKPYNKNSTSLPYFLKMEGCERRYTDRETATACIRGIAFAGSRSSALGNVVEGIVLNLAREKDFLSIRSDVRKKGISPQERFFACEELCHQFRAMLWNLGEWKIDISEREVPQVIIEKTVAVYPSISEGTGRMISTTWNVENCFDPIDEKSHRRSMDAAADMAARLEYCRVLNACSRKQFREHGAFQ